MQDEPARPLTEAENSPSSTPEAVTRVESTRHSASGLPAVAARAAVIGAGCSGLVTARALLQVGLEPVVFELGSQVGGLWVFDNDSGTSSAYRSLRINTSRPETELAEFPMPASWGDYPSHERIAEYLAAYAAHFELTRHVRFRTAVVHAEPAANGGYLLDLRDLETGAVQREHFDALVVASGHHHTPRLPVPMPPGTFSGSVLHAHDYRSPDAPLALRSKDVLVVGLGNSAVDIACELAHASGARVTISARRGAWILPKYLFGKPIDQGALVPRWLPGKLRRRIVTGAFSLLRGSMGRHGLPTPDHLIGEAHPTLSDELPSLVRAGRIGVRPAIAEFDGVTVRFVDGTSDEFAAIVYCTGYEVSFPYLSPAHVGVVDNELPLYFRVFHPEHRHLFFVGLAQTIGAILPVAREQAALVAEHLAGKYHLPEKDEISRAIQAETRRRAERYVPSARHTMQIDPHEYLATLERERKRGRSRAETGRGVAFPAPETVKS